MGDTSRLKSAILIDISTVDVEIDFLKGSQKIHFRNISQMGFSVGTLNI